MSTIEIKEDMTAREFKEIYIKPDKMNEIVVVCASVRNDGYQSNFMLCDDVEVLEPFGRDYITFYPVTAALFERMHQETDWDEIRANNIDLIMRRRKKER